MVLQRSENPFVPIFRQENSGPPREDSDEKKASDSGFDRKSLETQIFGVLRRRKRRRVVSMVNLPETHTRHLVHQEDATRSSLTSVLSVNGEDQNCNQNKNLWLKMWILKSRPIYNFLETYEIIYAKNPRRNDVSQSLITFFFCFLVNIS